MKEPVKSFDVQAMSRVRVRGSKDQVVAVLQWTLQQQQQAVPSLGFVCQLSSSGPVRDSEARQHFVHFYIANELVDELRAFLGLIGLEEET